MRLKINDPKAEKLLAYLSPKKPAGTTPIAAPDGSALNPYMHHGSHPEVVARVWETIGASLPVDCRCLLYGFPALLAPSSGVVLAATWAMLYVVRVPYQGLQTALQEGSPYSAPCNQSGLDVQREFGDSWVLGCYSQDEGDWCRAVYEEVEELRKQSER